jgi:hypothetical protein
VTLTSAGEWVARDFASLMLQMIERAVFDTFQGLLARSRDAAREVAAE